MTSVPIQAVSAVSAADPTAIPEPSINQAKPPVHSFSEMIFDGIEKVSEKSTAADALVRSFVLDDSIPPHRVMYALEQSRMSLQMMLQVRNRLVEGYQEIMRMQL